MSVAIAAQEQIFRFTRASPIKASEPNAPQWSKIHLKRFREQRKKTPWPTSS